jgi:hypothetical protein
LTADTTAGAFRSSRTTLEGGTVTGFVELEIYTETGELDGVLTAVGSEPAMSLTGSVPETAFIRMVI